MRKIQIGAALLGREQCDLRAFDAALAELAQSAPNVKRDIIAAVTACIAADGRPRRSGRRGWVAGHCATSIEETRP